MKKTVFVVGTQNPVKVQAVAEVVRQFWPEAEVFGIKVNSGVEKQPKTNSKTRQGALNRAKSALKISAEADYGVGLESGVEFRKDGLWTFGWVVVINRQGKVGLAKTVEFRLPEGLAQMIKEGIEQGEADARYFHRNDSGQSEGTVGLLTKGKVNREQAFSQATIFALVPFLNPGYY